MLRPVFSGPAITTTTIATSVTAVRARASVATIRARTPVTTFRAFAPVRPRRAFTTFRGGFATGRLCSTTRMLLVAFRHSGFAGKTHPALFIHPQALHPNLVTKLNDVFGLLDAEIGQLADVHQAVFARQEFNERTKVLNRNDFAAIDLADFSLGAHADDGITGNLHALFRHRVDVDRAVILDVDLAARLFDKLLDVLATRADEGADLVGVNLDGFNTRSVLAQFLARLSQSLGHLAKDVHARHASALDSLGHDLVRNAGQLEVQLETGDTLLRSSDLAVHIAERIFPPDDVGE